MSRFFRGGENNSSDSSSDEEDLYSGEDDFCRASVHHESDKRSDEDFSDADSNGSSDYEGGNRQGASKFLKDIESESEESDEGVRAKVKSAKDKRLDELEASIRQIENGQKIGDWTLISSEFDKLNRQVNKLQQDAGNTPKSYIRIITVLEDSLSEALAKQKVTPKKMNTTQARALNAVKQKIKKINKEYQSQIFAYRTDKDFFMLSDAEKDEEQIPKEVILSKPEADVSQTDPEDEGFSTIGKGGRALQYTPESIFKHLRNIAEARGKKNTDRLEQIKVMEKLVDIANTPYQKLRVLLALVSTRFDAGAGKSTSISSEQWGAAEKELAMLLDVLETSREYVVIENVEEWDDDEKPPTLQPDQKSIKIAGSVVSYVEKLDDELTRSLQSIDPHTPEYIERLQDEGVLYTLIFRALLYYERLKVDQLLEVSQNYLNRIFMRRLDHIYFKPAQVIKTFEENCWKKDCQSFESFITTWNLSQDANRLVDTLCTYLFSSSDGIIRARAMLCQVYFLALHDKYYRARDLMLMSHLQENIPNFDVSTQILYNRTLVQIGLCAFRQGLIFDTQTTLQEICGSGRQKELLAQGIMLQRYNQVPPEQERLEKQRQLPFHMHINLELLECVYLTCSMLLEIPLLAQTGSAPDVKKRVISKTYRRMLEYHERQIFTGPPENTRDHVMHASKALAAGEWNKAIEYIQNIKIWDLMPNVDGIKQMLSGRIQEEGLRTYLFTYAPFYDTLSVTTLGIMFELDNIKIASIISKMISHEEISASLDQVSSTVIFRKGVELSRLQSLALTLSDKASALIETNERTLEQRTLGTSNAFERQGGRGRGGQRGGQRLGRRGGNQQRQIGGTLFTGGALGAAVRT